MSVTIAVRNDKSDLFMNLSNRNFSTFWSALGLNVKDGLFGREYPQKILDRLRTFEPALALRETEESVGAQGCQMIDFGITPEQVRRYVWNLKKICDEAERKEEFVVWG